MTSAGRPRAGGRAAASPARQARLGDPRRPGGVSIEQARPADFERIQKILLAAYAEFAGDVPPALFESYVANLLELEQRAEEGEVLVAIAGDRIVGTVTYYDDASAQGFGWPEGWTGLRAIGVAPGARGSGVGSSLMAECLRRARLVGSPVVCLHTAEFMTAAVRLYHAFGFERAPAYDFAVPAESQGDGEAVRILGYVRRLPD